MDGTIIPASNHFNQDGHYFAAGHDVIRNEWYFFDGVRWVKFANSNDTIVSLESSLRSTGVTGLVFSNADLRAFPKGEIYLGYGVGATKMAAWADMNSSPTTRYKKCYTLPSN